MGQQPSPTHFPKLSSLWRFFQPSDSVAKTAPSQRTVSIEMLEDRAVPAFTGSFNGTIFDLKSDGLNDENVTIVYNRAQDRFTFTFSGVSTPGGLGGFTTLLGNTATLDKIDSNTNKLSEIRVLGIADGKVLNLTVGDFTDANIDIPTFVKLTATGADGNDFMDGNGQLNKATDLIFTGLDGNDTLIGGGGDDSLTGGLGDDTYGFDLDVEQGSDLIFENVDEGIDTISFELSSIEGGKVDLSFDKLQASSNPLVTGKFNKLNITLNAGNVIENFIGGSGNDIVTANSLNNTLVGGAGDDTFQFNLDIVGGLDVLDENGGGSDTVSLEPTKFQGGTIDLNIDGVQEVAIGKLKIILGNALNFENATGGGGADKLNGNVLDNILEGLGGPDLMIGAQGNDTYKFDLDDFDLGGDTIDETAGGIDTLDFSESTKFGAAVDLSRTGLQNVTINKLQINLLGGDQIENVIGSEQNDDITANGLDNILTLGKGNDIYRFNVDNKLGTDTVIEQLNEGIDALEFSAAVQQTIDIDLSIVGTQDVAAGNLILNLPEAFDTKGQPQGVQVEDIFGTQGDDLIRGNKLANKLTGEGGNDTYIYNLDLNNGSDTIDERLGGLDTLDFSATGIGTKLVIDLGKLDVPQLVTVPTGLPGGKVGSLSLNFFTEKLAEFAAGTVERVIGTNNNDDIKGNALANTLFGGGGNDLLRAQGGNDTYAFNLDTNQGIDLIDDRIFDDMGQPTNLPSGVDTLDFSQTTSKIGVQVDLRFAGSQELAIGAPGRAKVTLQDGNQIENVIGTSGADIFMGNTLDNTFDGLLGNDTYRYDASLSHGTDSIVDGGGIDVLDFSPTVATPITVDLGNPNVQTVTQNKLKLNLGANEPVENIILGGGLNTIKGGMLANTFFAGPGGGTIEGAAGNDRFVFDLDFNLGSYVLTDSEGVDILDFSQTNTVGIIIDLNTPNQQTVAAGKLKLTLPNNESFEQVLGGDGDDAIQGNSRDNKLSGGAGNDLYFFNVNNQLGADEIEDIGGIDTIDFTTSSDGVVIDLSNINQQQVANNLKLRLSASNTIENVIGGSGDDTLTGNELNNILIGGGGNDTFRFNLDKINGTDNVNAGDGVDTLDFRSTAVQGATVNMGTTANQTIAFGKLNLILGGFESLENLFGGGGNDVILGNSLNNIILGGGGADSIDGAAGADQIFGEAGLDTLIGSDGNDSIGGGDGNDSILGVLGNDALFGEAGSDTIIGGGGNDAIGGGDGNDFLLGSDGDDFIFGEGGNDNIDGEANNDAIGGGEGDDTIFGSTGNDLIFGEGGNDTIDGAAGDDSIGGGDGNDTIRGLGGNDLIFGEGGVDIILGDDGNDTIGGGAGNDSIVGSDGNDVLFGEGDQDTLIGGLGNDTLGGGMGDDSLTGGADNDSLEGEAGNDTLFGNEGFDTLHGGPGLDVIDGQTIANYLIQ